MGSRLTAIVRVRERCRSGEARRLRERADLPLSLIADEVGDVSEVTVSRWERAKQLPTGDRAVAYGRVLDRLRRLEDREEAV